MADKIYPFAVARIRMLENYLLTEKEYSAITEAKTANEVFKALSEAGYGAPNEPLDVKNYEKALSERLSWAYSSVKELVPKEKFINVFLYKNDYQNLKVLVKSDISGFDGEKYLVEGGSLTIDEIKQAFETKNYGNLTENMGEAIVKSYETYGKTQHGQSVDIIMDAMAFKDMALAAKKSKNKFIREYVTYLSDITNLKSYIRLMNMGKNAVNFDDIFVEGGSLGLDTFKKAFNSSGGADAFKETAYKSLCEYMNGDFTTFEKECDNYIMSYIKGARYKSLTIEPVIAFVYAVETEVKIVRIVISGKINGIEAGVLKERLRDAYV